MEHCPYQEAAKYTHSLLQQNWTCSIVREEAATLGELITGCRQAPVYVTESEAQREYQNPSTKSIAHLKHIEQNRYGRYAYSLNRTPPNGILPTYNAKAYPDVIPRFHFPKIPY